MLYFVDRMEIQNLQSRLSEMQDKGEFLKEELQKTTGQDPGRGSRFGKSGEQKGGTAEKAALYRVRGAERKPCAPSTKSWKSGERARQKWDRTALGLKEWEEQEVTSNAVLWDSREIQEGNHHASGDRESEKTLWQTSAKDIAFEKKELDASVEEKRKELRKIREEMEILGKGQKAYPRELKDARELIARELNSTARKPVKGGDPLGSSGYSGRDLAQCGGRLYGKQQARHRSGAEICQGGNGDLPVPGQKRNISGSPSWIRKRSPRRNMRSKRTPWQRKCWRRSLMCRHTSVSSWGNCDQVPEYRRNSGSSPSASRPTVCCTTATG